MEDGLSFYIRYGFLSFTSAGYKYIFELYFGFPFLIPFSIKRCVPVVSNLVPFFYRGALGVVKDTLSLFFSFLFFSFLFFLPLFIFKEEE